MTDHPVTPRVEPAKVEERHREKAHEIERVVEFIVSDGEDVPDRVVDALALAFAEFEREVLERERVEIVTALVAAPKRRLSPGGILRHECGSCDLSDDERVELGGFNAGVWTAADLIRQRNSAAALRAGAAQDEQGEG